MAVSFSEIYRLALDHPAKVARNFSSYGLKNPNEVIQVAEVLAACNGLALAYHFKSFAPMIPWRRTRTFLATTAVIQSHSYRHLANFNLTQKTESKLKKLAKELLNGL